MLKESFPAFHVHLFGTIRVSPEEIARIPGYDQVRTHLSFHGYTDQQTMWAYAQRATAGLAMLKPVADYADSYTTKLFEYMALGLPVITSNFELYKKVVEPSLCGFCISPYQAVALCEKMAWLLKNPAAASVMGQNGRHAAEKDYNWATEEQVLLGFYASLARAAEK